MNDPLVSVITPTFNPGSRLVRCLDSIAEQTYGHVEHLVIDGGSTDGTVEILESRSGIEWISEPDDGQSHALNKGFEMAKGELMTWINADDTLNPAAISQVVAAWRTTGAEWIYGNCEMWEGSKSHLWDPPSVLTEDSFDWVCPIAQQGTFFTKRAFTHVGGIDQSFDLSMDYDLWLRLFNAGVRSTFVPHVLGTFEIHDESKSGSRGYHEFMREGALALRHHGRKEASDVMLGRAAAQHAVRDAPKERIRTETLKRSVSELISSPAEFSEVDPALLTAGTKAEAADIEVRTLAPPSHLAGLRHLAHPRPWMYKLTRASARASVRIAIARALEKRRRR